MTLKTKLPIGTKAHVTNAPHIVATKIDNDNWHCYDNDKQRWSIMVSDAFMAEYLAFTPGQYNNHYTLCNNCNNHV